MSIEVEFSGFVPENVSDNRDWSQREREPFTFRLKSSGFLVAETISRRWKDITKKFWYNSFDIRS